MAKVAFIGLGVMGYPMAGHIARGGHDVTVYNRTAAKAEKWLDAFDKADFRDEVRPLILKENAMRLLGVA